MGDAGVSAGENTDGRGGSVAAAPIDSGESVEEGVEAAGRGCELVVIAAAGGRLRKLCRDDFGDIDREGSSPMTKERGRGAFLLSALRC